jgi:hypothetical protein
MFENIEVVLQIRVSRSMVDFNRLLADSVPSASLGGSEA